MMNGGFGLFRGLFCGLTTLLFWVAIIALLIWAIRAWSHSAGTRPGGGMGPVGPMESTGPAVPSGSTRALEILKERYARGEITREQYEEMRRDLTV